MACTALRNYGSSHNSHLVRVDAVVGDLVAHPTQATGNLGRWAGLALEHQRLTDRLQYNVRILAAQTYTPLRWFLSGTLQEKPGAHSSGSLCRPERYSHPSRGSQDTLAAFGFESDAPRTLDRLVPVLLFVEDRRDRLAKEVATTAPSLYFLRGGQAARGERAFAVRAGASLLSSC